MQPKCFSHNQSKLQQGFTLIELLVALGVSAVIAVLAYQSINNMVNVKTTVDQHIDQTEKWQRTVWRIQQDLVQMAPRSIQDQLGSALPAFQYREDTGLEFTSIAQYPTLNANGGLVRVGYQLEDNTLFRLTWQVLDRAQDTEVQKVALLKGVNQFEVALLNKDNKWLQNWPAAGQDSDMLPRATRVNIEHQEFGTISRIFMGAN
jgi:general secretion pathway protein J